MVTFVFLFYILIYDSVNVCIYVYIVLYISTVTNQGVSVMLCWSGKEVFDHDKHVAADTVPMAHVPLAAQRTWVLRHSQKLTADFCSQLYNSAEGKEGQEGEGEKHGSGGVGQAVWRHLVWPKPTCILGSAPHSRIRCKGTIRAEVVLVGSWSVWRSQQSLQPIAQQPSCLRRQKEGGMGIGSEGKQGQGGWR